MNKKNVMYGLLALLGLYFVTKKNGSSTDTPTEDKGTPDLGNGSTPTPTPSGPQASTPPVEVQQASTPPVVVNRASMPNEVNSSSQQVMYASTGPSMGEPKNVYSM